MQLIPGACSLQTGFATYINLYGVISLSRIPRDRSSFPYFYFLNLSRSVVSFLIRYMVMYRCPGRKDLFNSSSPSSRFSKRKLGSISRWSHADIILVFGDSRVCHRTSIHLHGGESYATLDDMLLSSRAKVISPFARSWLRNADRSGWKRTLWVEFDAAGTARQSPLRLDEH